MIIASQTLTTDPPMDYECFFHAEANGQVNDFVVGARIQVKKRARFIRVSSISD
jgi:hypothetical protein